MATLTKKDLLEAIEDMPMDAKICIISPETDDAYIAEAVNVSMKFNEKDYCDYETCVALKELGYKIPTSAYYMPNNNQLIFVSNPFRGGYVIDCFRSHNSFPKDVMTSNYIDAPTMYEAQKWLREEKHLHIEVRWYSNLWYEYKVKEAEGNVIAEGCAFPTYEEALSTAVRMAVESLKENEDGRM